ncbi:MAG: hypothetical protein Kow0077_24830 [Anaerolineae bacterium]
MGYRSPVQSGPPAWLVVLAGALLVFGGYFLWSGVRNFMQSSLQAFMLPTPTSVPEAQTRQVPTLEPRFTPVPTRTPVPPCQDFVVVVDEAIVRECPSTNCAIADVRREGQVVCVLERDYVSEEWYIVDLDASQFFTSLAYMHESLMRPLNPTPTPSITNTPLPTVTPMPTQTPLPTLGATSTPDPSISPTPSPTFTASPTPPLISG